MIIGPNFNQTTQAFARAQTQKYPQQLPLPNPYMNSQSYFPTQVSSQCGLCMKSFNLELNLPKLLPCGHTFCLFCLTLQENQTVPSIQIDCPNCYIKYQHVPAAHFETNIEVVKVLEKMQQNLQLQLPHQIMQSGQQYGYNGVTIGNPNSSYYSYRSPQKVNYSGPTYGTPTRPQISTLNHNGSQDIRQVAQIFEAMKLEAIQNSPQPDIRKSKSPIRSKTLQDFDPRNLSPVQRSANNQQPYQLCAREGCTRPRLVLMDGWVKTNYCSKQCDDLDQNKGAYVRNSDDLYRQASRVQGKSRSKSPIKLQNFNSQGYSPIQGNRRSKSPNQSRTAINNFKNKSVFSSDESGFESDNYKTPQINRVNTVQVPHFYNQNAYEYTKQNDSMVKQLNYDSDQIHNSSQSQIQNSLGAFGESAFEKFMRSQHKEKSNNSIFETPKTNAFTNYTNMSTPVSFNQSFNRQNTLNVNGNTVYQQYHQNSHFNDQIVQDSKLDIYLAPNDPSKCTNPPCRNRKFILNGMYLPVCSRKCAQTLNIVFNH
ncbi:histone-lysine n-methyltransferase mll2-like [Stylonychia lemnae]|uniref:Histone-lysine n-methyltransferase mll2-like n=1 Tax=Stylonychia lemnae TaxID=5949 RepID=A0A078AKA4_STYLE|nr:histone-lysine n-methyltransferase mll2-like [Stylonychia lemnae]|eukprot:CDW82619.1 histone-lysine n-methyltransferase mll2-like [Stylonychia lemnae]